MILPTKRITHDRALLSVGAEILFLLEEPKTVSRLWDELKRMRTGTAGAKLVTYDWFMLALDLLYSLNTVDLEYGRIRKVSDDTIHI